VRSLPTLLLFALVLPSRAAAQRAVPSDSSLVDRFARFTAITGYERAMADTLLSLLPRATRDRSGSVVLVLGSGAPRRLVACPLDEPGWIVGGVDAEGYLTLRRAAGRLPSPLFDQQLEGQRVTLFGTKGPVPGVVAVRSVHLTRGRPSSDEPPFGADDARIDVGASDARGVEALGIGVLTPLSLAKRPLWYGASLVAAPVAGRRAACAALVSAAMVSGPVTGTVVVAFVTEQNLSKRGLLTVRKTQGPFSEERLVDGAGNSAVLDSATAANAMLPEVMRGTAGSPAETVSLGKMSALRLRLENWIRESR
jgi:putative aminopeptidase